MLTKGRQSKHIRSTICCLYYIIKALTALMVHQNRISSMMLSNIPFDRIHPALEAITLTITPPRRFLIYKTRYEPCIGDRDPNSLKQPNPSFLMNIQWLCIFVTELLFKSVFCTNFMKLDNMKT